MADSKSICKIRGCLKEAHCKGLCFGHYRKLLRYGDPLSGGTQNGALSRTVFGIAFGEKTDDCVIWPHTRSSDGYGYRQKRGRKVKVHRLICRIVNGAAPSALHVVAHSCGKGHEGCVNPHHLRWATRRENTADMVGHGTMPRGERNGHAKLTRSDVLSIRRAQGVVSCSVLKDAYGVSQGTISDIWRRRTWSWLDGEEL